MGVIGKVIKNIKRGTLFSVIYNNYIRIFFYTSEKNVMKKQEKALDWKLRKVRKYVPFYKEYFKNVEKPTLEDFPIVDRHIIADNFEKFIATNYKKYPFHDAYTGGSTGEPFHLLSSNGYEAQIDLKRWKYLGYKKGDRILSMSGVKLDEKLLRKREYWIDQEEKEIPFGRVAMSSLYLSDDTAMEYCTFIKEYKPEFIWGYVSFVYRIADYAHQLGVDLKGFVKAIVVTSETAFPYQVDKIAEVFDARVCLQYGHTEACVNAYTFDDTYVFRGEPLYGYVEVLDDEGKQVEIGEYGEVVVTSLHNYVMPLVRYRTGDYAIWGGYDDRYYYLKKVLGRTQDYIYDRSGNKIILTALIFGQHFKAMGHIHSWQLEQFEKGKVIAHIIPDKDYSMDDEMELKKLFEQLGNVELHFDYVDKIELTPRGKSKMLIQHMEIV